MDCGSENSTVGSPRHCPGSALGMLLPLSGPASVSPSVKSGCLNEKILRILAISSHVDKTMSS